MNLVPLPVAWLEASIVVALLGAAVLSLVRRPERAAFLGLLFSGFAALGTLIACVSYFLCQRLDVDAGGSLIGQTVLRVDELNAPLLPVVGVLQFLTALATARTKMARYSYAWSMAGEAIRLAVFASAAPWTLVALAVLETISPFAQLVRRGKPTRVYVLHMALFAILLVLGQSLVNHNRPAAALLLLAAVLVRCGTIPAHCWVTDLFEQNSFGSSLLFVAPITGALIAVRLVLPIAPDGLLQGLGVISLATAGYASAMAVGQRDARRFFAFLFISHSSLVLVGMELASAHGLTGALCLWFSVALSLGGFGLTLRSLEARYGRLSLDRFRGLYGQSPALAVGFLVTGLASEGFPGTLGFISADLLVEGAIEASPWVGLAVAITAALNGIAVLRAYLLLFTGTKHQSSVNLRLGLRERLAVLSLIALVLSGGLIPQPGTASRHRAAEEILGLRAHRGPEAATDRELASRSELDAR